MTKLTGHFLFMLQSCSVRHAQLHAATSSRDKVAWKSCTTKSYVWHRSKVTYRLSAVCNAKRIEQVCLRRGPDATRKQTYLLTYLLMV